ncbi:hypothetical protein H6G64_31535 [Calothrix sp. FACHB-156]|nr:hypothetical protein [Calothrix sp. FACHB-156]
MGERAVRNPDLSWQDQVELWATTLQYSVIPDQIKLVILALHPVKTAQRLDVRWTKKNHRQTEKGLIKLLTQSQENNSPFNIVNSELASIVDLEHISEVSI